MNLPRPKPKIQVGTNITSELWDLAKKHNLNWSNALELGIRIQLADRGEVEYPNTSMKKAFNKMREVYEETTNIKEKPEERKPEDVLKDLENAKQ